MRPTAHLGDCVEVLAAMEPETFDSVVCDPPYHLTAGKKGGSGEASVNPSSPAGRSMVTTGFMGKQWDGGDVAFRPETWAAIARVMKPGAFLVAFGGTRTWHRLAVAIEDAGFEIRDNLQWLHGSPPSYLLWTFGSGFPKSRNISKDLSEVRCLCGVRGPTSEDATFAGPEVLQSNVCGHGEEEKTTFTPVHELRGGLDSDEQGSGEKPDLLTRMRQRTDRQALNGQDTSGEDSVPDLRNAILCPSEAKEEGCRRGDVLQPGLLGKDQSRAHAGDCAAGVGGDHAGGPCQGRNARSEEPSLEGRGDAQKAERELQRRALGEMPGGLVSNGDGERLRDGTSSSNGSDGEPPVDQNRVRSPSGPRSSQQPADQSGAMAGQQKSQAGGAWPLCDRCGKPTIPDGLGTSLKPAFEPIILARKPLAEKTIAANVLAHGVGALNVDGCRVASGARPLREHTGRSGNVYGSGLEGSRAVGETTAGRWPPNVLHDGSPEVLEAFARFGVSKSTQGKPRGAASGLGWGMTATGAEYEDSGTAARFFPELGFHYSGKATKADRAGSKHPTVKPQSLMRWLCRLVTPPGGHVLDPFAGSGSTLQAAHREGFRATGIELTPEHFEDIQRRLRLLEAFDDGLFAGMGECA